VCVLLQMEAIEARLTARLEKTDEKMMELDAVRRVLDEQEAHAAASRCVFAHLGLFY